MLPRDVEIIAQAGAIGLAILLIGLLTFIIRWFCKFINTTLAHNSQLTSANTKATNANIRAAKELENTVRELTTYFKSINGQIIPKNLRK